MQKFISLGARRSSPVKVPRAEVQVQGRHSAEKKKKKNSRNDSVEASCNAAGSLQVKLNVRVSLIESSHFLPVRILLSDIADVSVSQRRTAGSSRIDTGQATDLQLEHD